MNSFGFARVRINDDMADDCIRNQSHAPCASGGRECRSRAAVIRLCRTPSITMAAVMTRRPRVRRALMNRLSQDRAPAYDYTPERIIHLINRFFQKRLAAG